MALAAAAIVVLPYLIDAQRWRPYLEARASRSMGRRVSIEGEIGLTLFPRTELSLSGVRVANSEAFGAEDLLEVKRMQIRARPLPLLLGRIEVERLTMEGPRLVLGRDRDGRWNWRASSAAALEAREGEGRGRGATPEKGLLWAATSKGLLLTGGRVTWMDMATGDRYDLEEVTVALSDFSPGRRARLSASCLLKGRRISLEGDLGPLTGDPLRGDMPLDAALHVGGRTVLKAQGTISGPSPLPRFDLSLQVLPFSAGELLRILGKDRIRATDPAVLKNASFQCKVRWDGREAVVERGILHLDDSTVTLSGRASLSPLRHIEFDLSVDHLDVDAYLPPPAPRGRVRRAEEADRGIGTDARGDGGSLGLWSALSLQGGLQVGALRFRGARLQEVSMKLSAQHGVLSLSSIEAKGYGGSWAGSALLDLTGRHPKVDLEVTIAGAQVGPLLHDLARKDFLKGTLRGHLALHSDHLDLQDPLRSLQGQGDLSVVEGAILGVDLVDKVRHVIALRQREGKTAQPETPFSELRSLFGVSGGLLETQRSSLEARGLRIHAKGKADLIGHTLEFRLEPELGPELKGGEKGEGMAMLAVPVIVSGSFSSPTFRPDLEGISKGQGRIILNIPSRGRLKDHLKSLTR